MTVSYTHLISFGLKYVPGTDSDEIFALAELCKKDHKLVAAHVRQDVDGVFSAAQELAEDVYKRQYI